MADPLLLLQKYTTGNIPLHEITQNGELYYVFDDVAYPHNAKTNLGVYNKPDEYYSIESILLFWKMRELQHTAYVRDVSGRGIASITRVQRRELLDFLNGGALPKEANMLAPIPPPIPATHLQQDEQFQRKSHFEPEKKKPRLELMQEKKGQRIDKILDQSIDKATIASEVRGLSNELPAEKVAQLRSRIKNNRKNKTIDEESFVPTMDLSVIPNASNDTIGRFITEKERIRKDRTTCLESTSRNFSSVIAVLRDLQMRESQTKFPYTQTSATTSIGQTIGGATSSNSVSGRTPQKPIAGGYSRYDQEIFQRETVADFEIETDLSFHERNAAMMNKQSQAPSTHNPSSHNDVGVHQKGRAESTIVQQQQRQQPQKRVSRTPIIIIPASGTTLITMYNAQDILQDLRYISSDEKKRTYKRDNELLLQIRKNGATVPYRVIDNPTKLKDEEWDRVVAVFVQGPAWQFKGWKWNGNPVEIFANVAAFHLKFEEQKLDSNVAKWSVNVLQLSRTKRHLDRAILQKFWEILDRHISKSSKREWLRY